MGMIFSMKMLSDMSYYMYYAAFISAYFTDSAPPMMAVLLIALCCGISHAFKAKSVIFRVAPFVLNVLWLFMVGTLADFLILLPCLAYAVFTCVKSFYDTDVYVLRDRFSLCVKIMPVVVIFGLISSVRVLEIRVLPFALVYFFTSVFLLRILRHDYEVLSQTRFKILNAFSLAGAALAGLAFSTQAFFTAVKAALGVIYQVIIAPILMAIAYVFVFIAWGIGPLFKAIGNFIKQFRKETELVRPGETSAESTAVELEQALGATNYEVWETIARAALIITVCVIAFIIFKRLLGRRRSEIERAGAFEQRISLAPQQDKPRARVFRGPSEQVRAVYRKFLALCKSSGITLKIDYTSIDVLHRAKLESWYGDEAGEMREIYLAARYEGGDIGRAEVNKAKASYAALRARARRNK